MERIMELNLQYPKVGLIFSTATFGDDSEYVKLAKDHLGILYLPKPYRAEDLIDAIETAVREAKVQGIS